MVLKWQGIHQFMVIVQVSWETELSHLVELYLRCGLEMADTCTIFMLLLLLCLVSLLCFHLSLSCTIHSYLYAVACKDNSQAACCLLTLYSIEVVT